jgi:hypothetical protein
MIPTLVHNETNFNNKNCIFNANGSSQSTTQSSYLDYWQMLSITNAKPKKKKKVFSFPKVKFFMLFVDHLSSKSVVEVFPSNPLSPRTIKNTKQNHTNAHHRSSKTINLQQTTTQIHIHTRRRIFIN